MPEVIDLRSSPELAPTRPAASKSTAPNPVFKPSNPTDNNFFELSDDNEDLPPLKVAPKKSAAATFKKPITEVCDKPAISTSKPAIIASTKLVATSSSTKPATILVKGSSNFVYLEDDFDSTGPLDDDPFEPALPPSKKRRVSPSPRVEPAELPISRRSFAKPKMTKKVLESDPLVFTSSPDPYVEAARRRKQKWEQRKDGSDDDIVFGDLARKEGSKSTSNFKGAGHILGQMNNPLDDFEFSDDELPDLNSLAKKAPAKYSKTSSSQRALDKYNADKANEKAAKDKVDKSKDKVDKTKDKVDKTKEKVEKAKEKAAAKEAEKEQKRLEREKKAYEKTLAAELVKVNTLRTDKKVSTPEMIVDLSSSLNPILLEQVYKMLSSLDIEHTDCESQLPIVKWRRKVDSRFNVVAGHWEPAPKRIKAENHVMCVISAQAFVNLVTGAEDGNVDAHVLRLKSKFDSCEIIYLLEGHNAWMKKNKNLLNRQYTAAARSHEPNQVEPPAASQKSRKKKELEYVNEDLIEDALLRLQIVHGAFIHHTNAMVETAEWIVNFTQHISTIPYKTEKDTLDTAFCMDSGQVKTGDDAEDTYVRMLQEIKMITASVAYGIAYKYPTVQELVGGLERNGPLALADLKKGMNKDGGLTDRRVGPSISKRVHKVFLGTDPGSWDV